MFDHETLQDLESIIDRCGIESVRQMLVEIASEKALHVASAWQDYRLEENWNQAAQAFDSVILPSEL